MLDILQIHSFHGYLRYLDNAMNCAFFKFEENYPSSYLPRQNSQQFQLKVVQATSSKGITNISLSPKKSFSKPIFDNLSHERFKFSNIELLFDPRKHFESSIYRFTDEKKNALENRREDQRYLSIRGLTEDEYQNATRNPSAIFDVNAS